MYSWLLTKIEKMHFDGLLWLALFSSAFLFFDIVCLIGLKGNLLDSFKSLTTIQIIAIALLFFISFFALKFIRFIILLFFSILIYGPLIKFCTPFISKRDFDFYSLSELRDEAICEDNKTKFELFKKIEEEQITKENLKIIVFIFITILLFDYFLYDNSVSHFLLSSLKISLRYLIGVVLIVLAIISFRNDDNSTFIKKTKSN